MKEFLRRRFSVILKEGTNEPASPTMIHEKMQQIKVSFAQAERHTLPDSFKANLTLKAQKLKAPCSILEVTTKFHSVIIHSVHRRMRDEIVFILPSNALYLFFEFRFYFTAFSNKSSQENQYVFWFSVWVETEWPEPLNVDIYRAITMYTETVTRSPVELWIYYRMRTTRVNVTWKQHMSHRGKYWAESSHVWKWRVNHERANHSRKKFSLEAPPLCSIHFIDDIAQMLNAAYELISVLHHAKTACQCITSDFIE